MLLSEKLYNKYKNSKNEYIIEAIVQYYLIEKKIRNIAQINIDYTRLKKVNNLIRFLNKNKILYIINEYIIIIYEKYNIEDINKSFGKKYGKQLGIFYKCSTNNFSKNKVRIVINLYINNYGNIELYAQMCNEKQVKKYYNDIYNFYSKTYNVLQLLDKNIFCTLDTYNIKSH